MAGEMLDREVLRIWPAIPVILCAGFIHVMTAAKAIGMRAYLMRRVRDPSWPYCEREYYVRTLFARFPTVYISAVSTAPPKPKAIQAFHQPIPTPISPMTTLIIPTTTA